MCIYIYIYIYIFLFNIQGNICSMQYSITRLLACALKNLYHYNPCTACDFYQGFYTLVLSHLEQSVKSHQTLPHCNFKFTHVCRSSNHIQLPGRQTAPTNFEFTGSLSIETNHSLPDAASPRPSHGPAYPR